MSGVEAASVFMSDANKVLFVEAIQEVMRVTLVR